MSIALAISSMRLMFCHVSVTRIEFVRSKTLSMPVSDLKFSSAFCASSVAIDLNDIMTDMTLPSFASSGTSVMSM